MCLSAALPGHVQPCLTVSALPTPSLYAEPTRRHANFSLLFSPALHNATATMDVAAAASSHVLRTLHSLCMFRCLDYSKKAKSRVVLILKDSVEKNCYRRLMCSPCDWCLASAYQSQHSQKNMSAAWRAVDCALPPLMKQRATSSQDADAGAVCLNSEPAEEADQHAGE